MSVEGESGKGVNGASSGPALLALEDIHKSFMHHSKRIEVLTGVDLSVENLLEEIETVKPDILGLSALLTTTLPEMDRVIKALEANGLRDRVKVMVGGAPVGKAFAEKIGADGYGADAAEAVALARELVEVP